MDEIGDNVDLQFFRERNIKFCVRSLFILPHEFERFDSSRLVFAFFALSSLDLIKSISSIKEIKNDFIEWVYYLQVTSEMINSKKNICGFRGSTPCTIATTGYLDLDYYDKPSIAMTYTALASLLILGDDLEGIDKKGIINSLKELQLPDGSFRSVHEYGENDMRFVYCASSISYILNDWSGMDVDQAVKYIQDSISYEGGIAQGPGLEAHGGSTFCAIASLWLMGRLQSALSYQQIKRLKRWCLLRQTDESENVILYHGLQGRPNKPIDTCYSFWIGATLCLLDSFQYLDHQELRKFIFTCQDSMVGGISKYIDNPPDIIHTYLGIGGLSFIKCDDFIPVHPALNISEQAVEHLMKLHKLWNCEKTQSS